MNQSDDSIQSEFLVTYSFSFLFNKLEKVDSFLFPLFNSVKKRVDKLCQQPKICTFSRKLSNSKPNTSVKLVIIDWQNAKKTLHICSSNMQGFALIFDSQTENFLSQKVKVQNQPKLIIVD